jgi:hypothetical protein
LKRKEAALAGAVVIIVAILTLASFPLQSLNHTLTSTTSTESSASTGLLTNETKLSASNYNSSLGIRLTLSITNGTIPRNAGISLRISLNNTLVTQNTLSPTQEGLISFGDASFNLQPCSYSPIGIEIFQGNYVPGNLSQGKHLRLLGPNAPVNCAALPRSEISFAPLSSNLTSPTSWLVQSTASTEYWGYWTGVNPYPNDGGFSSFQPGTYTLEGLDWWGQVALLHFRVVPNPNPLDCDTIASNSSFVERTNFSASAGPLKLERYYLDVRSNNTVVLAFTTTGNSTLTVSNPYINDLGYGIGPFLFSPNSTLPIQTYQFRSSNGTLSNPIVVFPNQCSLVSVAFQSDYVDVPLLFGIDNQTQSFALNR